MGRKSPPRDVGAVVRRDDDPDVFTTTAEIDKLVAVLPQIAGG